MLALGGFNPLQVRPDLQQQAITCLRWGDAAGCAVKEPHPEALLEPPEVLTERGGRDP